MSCSTKHPLFTVLAALDSTKVLLAIATLTVLGCKDLTGNPGLPAGTPDPATYNNAAGALGMRNATIVEVELTLPQYIIDTGLLTDELEDAATGVSAGVLLQNGGTVTDPLDERLLPTGTTGGVTSYGNLQGIREFADQAIGALATYDTATANRDTSKVLRAELYAMEGYAEIMLADLFCSGVPLSTLDFQKDFTYAPSSTTTQMYQTALGKLDTTLTLAMSDTNRVQAAYRDSVINLAHVLQGRAYLDWGCPTCYVAAADDVAGVPDGFQYQLTSSWVTNFNQFSPELLNITATVSSREGENGLPFGSSGDPRSAVVGVAIDPVSGDSLYFPVKYSSALSGAGYAPITLASGTEARLIQAEAALHGVQTGAGSWIDQLNALRTKAGLSTIADPGSADPAAQVDTLFTERAYWLFLDGHRQGDLRRLLRNYGSQSQYSVFRSTSQVYPTGPYLAPGTGVYGSDTNAPVPTNEEANPYFHGCLSRVP